MMDGMSYFNEGLTNDASNDKLALSDGEYYGLLNTWDSGSMTIELLEYDGRNAQSYNYMLNPTGQILTLNISQAEVWLEWAWGEDGSDIRCASIDAALNTEIWGGGTTVRENCTMEIYFVLENKIVQKIVFLYAAERCAGGAAGDTDADCGTQNGCIVSLDNASVTSYFSDQNVSFSLDSGKRVECSIIKLHQSVRNCTSIAVNLEITELRAGNVQGEWGFYVRDLNGTWHLADTFELNGNSTRAVIVFDEPMDFDAWACPCHVLGNYWDFNFSVWLEDANVFQSDE